MTMPGPHSGPAERTRIHARDTGARRRREPRPPDRLEWAVLGHVGIFIILSTWAFGGAAEWMRPWFTGWGGLGAGLTLAALLDRDLRRGAGRTWWWLLPVAGFNAFVLIATQNPSFQPMAFGTETVLAHVGGDPMRPGSAQPAAAVAALLQLDAIWLSCFNVALVVRRRRAIRGLLLLLAANALALSVFGTAQALVHAPGPYFGQVATRQPYFFATFVYHNHWGAFVMTMITVCAGLAWHYARRVEARNFLHSPAFGGLVAVLLLAMTVPLSGSRSCTLFTLLLLSAAGLHGAATLVRSRRRLRTSIVPPFVGAGAALVVAAAAIGWVARDRITTRAALTRTQVAAMLDQGSLGARAELYRDTWRMAQDKPWFGWGMGSYPLVFHAFYNTQQAVDRLPIFYRDAHSDWLQAFAEHGAIGSALLALCAIVPLLRLPPRQLLRPVPAYLLGGCGLLLLYAWIEFPFANMSVVLTWWLCFFCGVQYARLHAPSADAPGRSPAGSIAAR